MENNCYGMHLTLRIKNVEKYDLLNSKEIIHDFLIKLVADIKMRVLAGPLVGQEISMEGKSGCSGLILLYESHAAIHTYVDMKEAFLDIFSCKEFDTGTISNTLSEYFGNHDIVEMKIFDRGYHWQTDLQASLNEWQLCRR